MRPVPKVVNLQVSTLDLPGSDPINVQWLPSNPQSRHVPLKYSRKQCRFSEGLAPLLRVNPKPWLTPSKALVTLGKLLNQGPRQVLHLKLSVSEWSVAQADQSRTR